ncbi:MAG: UbiA family prenyltransferase [Candidatus Moranbacteria bacterium]|nr:UbiA family prenyltransferase [Candidatus Moranbacteria bacterium]
MKTISCTNSFRKKSCASLISLVESIETAPITLGSFSLSFLAIILVRLLIENGTNLFASEPLDYILYEYSHTLLFFLLSFLVFLPIARLAGAASWARATNLLLIGFLIIWSPPVIDKIIFGEHAFWSFYELDGISGLAYRFFHFFGDTPNIGITYGVRIEVALMSVGLGLYSFFRSRSWIRALGVLLLSYLVFFILGTFPSYIAILALATQKGLFGVTEGDIAGYMLSPKRFFGHNIADPRMALSLRMSLAYAILCVLAVGTFLFRSSRQTFLSLLGNVRWPQIIWHGGLLFLGGGLAAFYAGADMDFDLFEVLSIISMTIAVISAWLASVVPNDLADRHIDALTNPSRPIPKRHLSETLYRSIGLLFFFVSILFSSIVSVKAALFLLVYQAIAWIYSTPPLRLKRIPFVATFLSAAAGMTVLFSGYSVLAPTQDISAIPFPLLAFLFLCYAVTIPLKDFKDIRGDKADGVITIPVLFGEEGGRYAVGTALFCCYVASPVVLHDAGLFLPAFIFGSIAFLSIRRADRKRNRWLTLRSLPAWNILLATLYGFIVLLFLVS